MTNVFKPVIPAEVADVIESLRDPEGVGGVKRMELGNIVFGNSRGEYPVPREWQDAFCERLVEMGFDSYGIPREWDDNHIYSPEIGAHLDEFEREVISDNGNVHKWETDVFVIMPYYWGDDDAIAEMPNFVYKPTGFELSWYKYALRDAYMNQDVTFAQLDEMLRKCIESIHGRRSA